MAPRPMHSTVSILTSHTHCTLTWSSSTPWVHLDAAGRRPPPPRAKLVIAADDPWFEVGREAPSSRPVPWQAMAWTAQEVSVLLLGQQRVVYKWVVGAVAEGGGDRERAGAADRARDAAVGAGSHVPIRSDIRSVFSILMAESQLVRTMHATVSLRQSDVCERDRVLWKGRARKTRKSVTVVKARQRACPGDQLAYGEGHILKFTGLPFRGVGMPEQYLLVSLRSPVNTGFSSPRSGQATDLSARMSKESATQPDRALRRGRPSMKPKSLGFRSPARYSHALAYWNFGIWLIDERDRFHRGFE